MLSNGATRLVIDPHRSDADYLKNIAQVNWIAIEAADVYITTANDEIKRLQPVVDAIADDDERRTLYHAYDKMGAFRERIYTATRHMFHGLKFSAKLNGSLSIPDVKLAAALAQRAGLLPQLAMALATTRPPFVKLVATVGTVMKHIECLRRPLEIQHTMRANELEHAALTTRLELLQERANALPRLHKTEWKIFNAKDAKIADLRDRLLSEEITNEDYRSKHAIMQSIPTHAEYTPVPDAVPTPKPAVAVGKRAAQPQAYKDPEAVSAITDQRADIEQKTAAIIELGERISAMKELKAPVNTADIRRSLYKGFELVTTKVILMACAVGLSIFWLFGRSAAYLHMCRQSLSTSAPRTRCLRERALLGSGRP